MARPNGSRICQVDSWRRSGRLAGITCGLILVERMLVGEVGSPPALARTLRDLGDPWTDPVVSVLALMALVAEALAGYLLFALALHSLSTLPGVTGRVARRVLHTITPAVVRRLVDLLVGGTLLVQVALAAPGPVPDPGPSGPYQAMAASSAISRSEGAAADALAAAGLEAAPRRWPADTLEPVEARPTRRRSAVPLPPWLGGGPSKAVPGSRAGKANHTVEAGDTLWDIAAAHLLPAERSAASIHRYWHQIYRANRPVVGADPGLIHPGTRLDVVPFRRDRP